MEIENVMFWISSIYIIPIWGLMWFVPRHEITKKIVGDLRISVLPLLSLIHISEPTRPY